MTLFLDLDDLVRINRTWLYQDLKVLGLQENVKLAQKGEYQTWMAEVPGSIPTGGNFWVDFYVPMRKASNANIDQVFELLQWPILL